MPMLRKKIALFFRDAISLLIYIFLTFRRKRRGVTLVYHSVGYEDPRTDPYRLNISPELLERHLKAISLHNGAVDITFDDGYGNNFENALPLLKRYGLTATIFLTTDFLDAKLSSGDFGGADFKTRPLTWDEVKLMDKAGIKFGSHSRTHRILADLSESELKSELLESKKRIEHILGHEIVGFAYPRGNSTSFNDAVKRGLAETGYLYSYTNIMGSSGPNPQDRFAINRIRIYSEDGPFRLKMKMKGAYDWVDTIFGKRKPA